MNKLQQNVLSKIVDKAAYLFAKPAIELSRREMTRLIKTTKFTDMKVWSKKLSGVRMKRVMQTWDKQGTPVYNYIARGYWVMKYDNSWRTIVLKTVEKIKLGNQFYKVK
jgi:hypothetical protein